MEGLDFAHQSKNFQTNNDMKLEKVEMKKYSRGQALRLLCECGHRWLAIWKSRQATRMTRCPSCRAMTSTGLNLLTKKTA